MLHKTRGIVLHTTDYAESSLIVKIYTELYGMQSYLINSVRRPKAKINSNLFQPLTLVELVVYHKHTGNLQRLKEISSNPQLVSIPYFTVKTSVAMFLNEVIYYSIREEEANSDMFRFLFN